MGTLSIVGSLAIVVSIGVVGRITILVRLALAGGLVVEQRFAPATCFALQGLLLSFSVLQLS